MNRPARGASTTRKEIWQSDQKANGSCEPERRAEIRRTAGVIPGGCLANAGRRFQERGNVEEDDRSRFNVVLLNRSFLQAKNQIEAVGAGILAIGQCRIAITAAAVAVNALALATTGPQLDRSLRATDAYQRRRAAQHGECHHHEGQEPSRALKPRHQATHSHRDWKNAREDSEKTIERSVVKLAEGEGFEPPDRLLTDHPISNRAPSTNSATLPHC